MLFERFEDQGLAQYSYAVGCPGSGKIAIVDPRRDVDIYLQFAHERGLAISHVLETHIHADYASGARELAECTGAELLVSGHDRGETFEVTFPHRDFMDGDSIEIGSVRVEALHTPGHTPEHLSFLVYDGARSAETPMLMLSGDFLFVGSLGRPDLLGEAQKQALAERLFASVREKLAKLPDGLEIHPAHGAGSMCGAGMSGRPVSTLGFERIANPYLDPKLTREEFIRKLLAATPPFPDYYRRMKKVNAEGPKLLHGLPGRQEIEAGEFHQLVESGHLVIDLRDQLAFGGGHIPGSFGIGLGPNLSTWASWVVPYERPILLVPDDPARVEEAVRALVRVGLDDVRGFLEGGIAAWRNAGLPLSETAQTTPSQLHEALQGDEAPRVLDVRSDQEWESGHVEGALHVFGGDLPKRTEEMPRNGHRLALVCGSGYRSTVAASVLERAGFRNLLNVTGGMGAWQRAGLPVARSIAS